MKILILSVLFLVACEPRQGTIYWKSKITGQEGHGQPMSYRDACYYVDGANRGTPEIHHWVQ